MQNFLDINMETINKALNTKGRATRIEFWYFVAFNWIVGLGASFLDIFIPGQVLENIVSILLFVPALTVAIRRMHDTNRSGWWLLAPIANLVFLLSPSKPSRWSAI
jgi:uncharacterized membrane protein YhaH (DUF805 family)